MKQTSMHGFGLFKDASLHHDYLAGEIIFQAGDESDTMYVVVDGELCFTLHGNEVDTFTAVIYLVRWVWWRIDHGMAR
jgi:hypothetical protein